MATKTAAKITDWWPGQGAKAGQIVFKVTWTDGTTSTTTRRVDLELPGDMIKDFDYLYGALKAVADAPRYQ